VITVDSQLAAHIRVARVGQIWRRSRWAVFLYVVLFLPLGLGTPLAFDHPLLFTLMLAAFVVTGVVRWRTLLMGAPPELPDDVTRWLKSFGVQTAISALLWGGFACYMQIAYSGTFLQFAFLLISAGIACFAMGAFAGDRHLTFTYLYCAMVPTLAGVAWQGDGEALMLLSLMSIFLVAVTSQIFEMNEWFVRSTVESLHLERARKEAELAARAKSDFLANMSHELRTPMNGVMGTLELLLQSGLDREQQLLVRTSHRSAEALLEILNDILDFSKMSAGKLDFAHQDFEPRNAVEDVYDLLGPRAIEKGLDLGYTIDPAIPDWVCGDEGRLRQVLMNLVSNAIKFSHGGDWPSGGSVFVEARLMSADAKAVHMQFSVTDRGPGMNPVTLKKLFEPFMQADTSTSRRFGGTGLGLAISRQLVQAMGGSISAESEENHGAKFSFDIKLDPASKAHTHVPPPASCNVLVFEPAPLSRATITQLVGRHGSTVRTASTFVAATNELASGKFDCVIAGTGPGVPVAVFLSQLRGILPEPAPPVILVHNRGETIEPGLVPSGTAIPRPVRSAQIAEALVVVNCLPRDNVPARVAPPARLQGHVLIAEDNPVNQVLAQRLVAALGLTAEVVSNGAAAIDALTGGTFCLVLMDCQMPGLDGYETTRRLRRQAATEHLPIVAMTANAMKGDRELCLAAGMNDYVSKPIRLEKLRDVLSRYLPPGESVPEAESSK